MPLPQPPDDSWHIVKDTSGQCQIVDPAELAMRSEDDKQETWGPFDTQQAAIARRVGLIRAGKCKPA